ncbi:MAG: bifunctional glutamate N-acetyltransferase/amino-acid acetyltransferase ArgJ [bacterium]
MFPKGFKVLGIHSGIYKNKKKKDLAVFYSDVPTKASAVFTTSKLLSAAITYSKKNLNKSSIKAITVNSGCANTCTGSRGLEHAKLIAAETAKGLNIEPNDVLLASTGIIGTFLPINKVLVGVRKITKDIYFHNKSIPSSGAEAIMTTDTQKKISTRNFKVSNRKVSLWGCAKGSGMIHPQMATMLSFVLCDVSMPVSLLRRALKEAVDQSFNSISIDGETSPNDTVYILANNASGIKINNAGSLPFRQFQRSLNEVCLELAKKIIEDGEGARKFIEMNVLRAKNLGAAKKIAMLVATSPLVKTAFAGGDANWGRIFAVIGRSGVEANLNKIDIYFNNIMVVKNGLGISKALKRASSSLLRRINIVDIIMNQGIAQAQYLTCDLTEMYVRINANFLT